MATNINDQLAADLHSAESSTADQSTPGFRRELNENAAYIGASGKHILDATKSSGINAMELCRTGFQNFSGVLVDEETLNQKTADGESLFGFLTEHELLVGVPIKIGPEEPADGLAQRCQKYYDSGARFAILYGPGNCSAHLASILREKGLLPIAGPSGTVGYVTAVLEWMRKKKNVGDHRVLLEGNHVNPIKVIRSCEELRVTPQANTEQDDGSLTSLNEMLGDNAANPDPAAGEMTRDGANFEMPEGGGQDAGARVIPINGANFEMPGNGGPVLGAPLNLRPAEYIYEFRFGFDFHFTVSAQARAY